MSIKARFYTYSKPIDSTARPTGTGTEYDITLKEATSITAPVIELHASAIGYNYCYIQAFSRYYFVQNTVILNHNRIEFHLSVDVLATWRTEILDSSLYVLRSASSYSLKLYDDTWTHTTDFSENVYTTSFPGYDATGCYIVTIVNGSAASSANPASCMYLMNEAGLTQLMAELFDDIQQKYDLDDLTATYFNPAQYITSCRWLPFDFNTLVTEQGTSFELIKYGWYTAETAGGYRVVKYGKTLTFSMTVGPSPYADWTDRNADWTRYALYVPGFGVTEIDPQFSGQTLSGKISIDFNTGQANLMLTTGANQIASQLSGKVGSEVSINQVGGSIEIPQSVGGLISKAGQVIGGTVAKAGGKTVGETVLSFIRMQGSFALGDLRGTIEEGKNMINSGKEVASAAADSAKQAFMNPTVTTSGADGCRYTIIDNHTIILYRRKYAHYNPAVAKLGGVCNQVKTLSTLSGYTVVANGLVDMPGTIEERNAVCSLLEGGFIIA